MLHVIVGLCRFAMYRSLTPLRAMAGTTKVLNEMVQNLLDYARVEAGAARAEAQECSLQEISNEMKELAAFLLQERAVRFRVVPELTSATVTLDGMKLRSILRNLVANAVKFTHRGEITLRLDRAGNRLRVEVKDTGIGIPLEDQEAIFEATSFSDVAHDTHQLVVAAVHDANLVVERRAVR